MEKSERENPFDLSFFFFFFQFVFIVITLRGLLQKESKGGGGRELEQQQLF